MKLAILGAAGLRTPLIVRDVLQRKIELGIDELVLMDTDGERLARIRDIKLADETGLKITPTTLADEALDGADFVITTYRVGGMEARVIDETIPLRYGIIGQETVGPGGFSMAMRSIPVLLGYLRLMEDLCPNAWLLNFSNPSGVMAEAALRVAGWKRTIGICDAPATMQRIAARLFGVPEERVALDYFGLNHLGWVRRVLVDGKDMLPAFLEQIQDGHASSLLPFSAELLKALAMVPNEYLVYYYQSRRVINQLIQARETRGQKLLRINRDLFTDLARFKGKRDRLRNCYQNYLKERAQSYLTIETNRELDVAGDGSFEGGGYAGVALNVIAGLLTGSSRPLVLNVLNRGAITGMGDEDVVELPTTINDGTIQPLSVGTVPGHCLGLMQQVKAYEKLTIEAATSGCYESAWLALSLHPLVADEEIARRILNEYIAAHKFSFPKLL